MGHDLASKRLYIADLARRQSEMETGRVPMEARAYRVVAKRLREAVAGFPEPALYAGFADMRSSLQPVLEEVLETRYFDHHGRLHGPLASVCRADANALMAALMRRPDDRR